jgi:hypothetical protein
MGLQADTHRKNPGKSLAINSRILSTSLPEKTGPASGWPNKAPLVIDMAMVTAYCEPV